MNSSVRILFVIAIAMTGPVMLAIDFALRHFFVAAQPEDLRVFLADHVTPIAWCVVPFPILGGIVGFRWYPARFRKSFERWRRDASISTETATSHAQLEALFLTTTLAQLPAVLGDLSLILGARLAPALCSTTASVTAVLLIGAFAHRTR